MTLYDLKNGMSAIISNVGGDGALRQHFLDMGVIPGAEITFIKRAPLGDPIAYMIHSYELTLRADEAKKIEIENIHERKKENNSHIHTHNKKVTGKSSHPGFGESKEEREHHKEHANPTKGTLTFALAGNPNCGKTTLFNQLTGSNQHVGNFPGVTVDKKSGVIKNYSNTLITDLPGIYSMSPYTNEEIVSRQFVLEEKPTAIINIVDATNIERNLYLSMQLMELDVPMILALNMMDELEGNGGHIHINEMEEALGIPVVPVSALKGQGIDELISHAIHIAKYGEKPEMLDFCENDGSTESIHRCLHSIMHLIEDHAVKKGIPVRFAASKIVEGDKALEDSLEPDEEDKESIEKIIKHMENECGKDRAAAMASMRYSFIEKLCEKTVLHPVESKEYIRSKKADKILTGRFTAIPLFIAIMLAVFFLTFEVLGKILQDLIETGIVALTEVMDSAMQASGVNEAVRSLVVDGIFAGVGSVLSFIPIIVILFFFLSILEDSGYMARVAFVMDKPLRKIGLSGRSIVPMLIGFGCTVPAVMSTRTLPSERDRRMTILLTPFMSCSAKMPIYAFLTAAFFPDYSWLIMAVLYFGGIGIAVLVALFAKKFFFRGEAVPFVMELPNYRMPGAKNVGLLVWDKAKDFLKKAFTVILIGTIVIWFLQSFDFSLNLVSDSKNSMLAGIAGFISPIFIPLGFGDWRVTTSLISGFIAKESVVSTLSVLFAGAGGITALFTPFTAFVFLVFCLLYTPCIAAVSAVRREEGMKWAVFTVIFQCAIAWGVAALVRIIGSLFIV